jgi:hypothetical protein
MREEEGGRMEGDRTRWERKREGGRAGRNFIVKFRGRKYWKEKNEKYPKRSSNERRGRDDSVEATLILRLQTKMHFEKNAN